MFVNKIGNGLSKQIGFKGYTHEIDDYGANIYRFTYPFDYNTKNARVEIFTVKRSHKEYCGYEIEDKSKPIASIPLGKEGAAVNMADFPQIKKGEPFVYRIVVDGNPAKETGTSLDINNEYILVSQKTTTPMSQGAGYLVMVDNLPQLKRAGFGATDPMKILPLDKERETKVETGKRTFANINGGTFASLEARIPELRQAGIEFVLPTPMTNGDNRSSHGYWNKNNFQVSGRYGTLAEFKSLLRAIHQNDMRYIFDGTFTSEGLEGVNLQYALRWAKYKTDQRYMFNIESLKDSPITYGIVPQNDENFRCRFINAPDIIEQGADGKITVKPNPKYNPDKPTRVQYYDKRYVTPEQLSSDEPIEGYEIFENEDRMAVNSSADTNVPYIFEIYDWKEILSNLKKIEKQKIKLDSAEGAITVSENSSFKLGKTTEGASTWTAKNDMILARHEISPYDEKQLMTIPNESERIAERARYERAAYQNMDKVTQAGSYWTRFNKDVIITDLLQSLKDIKTYDDLMGRVPESLKLNKNAFDNIVEGNREDLMPIGEYDRDNTTIRALMNLQLASLPVAENTQGILKSPYFLNMAAKEDQIGKTRFELMEMNNPHLDKEHAGVYSRVNDMFTNEIKNFADKIISELNKNSEEKLLDESGQYTEYGEYVVNYIGEEIARYAFLKALAGKSFKAEILNDGEINYDESTIKENTYRQGIVLTEKPYKIRVSDASNPAEEASYLAKAISKGLKDLGDSDVKFLSEAFGKKLEGTSALTFRLADVLYVVTSKGAGWRIDAAKDTMNIDGILNGEISFDEEMSKLIKFWQPFIMAVKKYNPTANINAELTDTYSLMQKNYGDEFKAHENYDNLKAMGKKYKTAGDFDAQFINETGITAEADYEYFFSNIINSFSRDFNNEEPTKDAEKIRDALNKLITTKNPDFIRNMFNFVGNQDKPRIVHYLALDLGLFHSGVLPVNEDDSYNHQSNQLTRELGMQIIAGSEAWKDIPLELKLNMDNIDYVRTMSPKAIAMSKLLKGSMDGVNIDSETRAYLLKALGNLTEGRYKEYGPESKLTVKAPELTSLYKAFEAILAKTDLPQDKKDELLNRIPEEADARKDLFDRNLVVGDFSDADNLNKLKLLLDENISEEQAKQYSLYTVCVTSLLRDAINDLDNETKNEIYKGMKEFVKEFNADRVKSESSEFSMVETPEIAMRKNGYAEGDIEYNIAMLFEQAEYLAKQDGKEINLSDDIMLQMYKNALEPAIQKAIMMMHLLSSLPGLPVLYHGDEFGATGGEKKANNIYLQNRNALKLLELQEGMFKELREKIASIMEQAVLIRSRNGIDPLNNGTPYMLHTPNHNVITYMMQNGDGDAVIPIINLQGISHDYRSDYGKNWASLNEYEKNDVKGTFISTDNKQVPIQESVEFDYIEFPDNVSFPAGTELRNTDPSDNAKYVVVCEDGKYRLRRESKDGNRIVLNQSTAKNGVLILTTMLAAIGGAMYKRHIKTGQMGKYLSGYIHKL